MINRKNLFICFYILSSLFFLSSCNKTNNIKPENNISNWDNVSNWSLNGKMAINNGENSGSGRITWQQSKDTLTATFKAPLGQGSWTIKEQTDQSELISSTNGTSHAETAEILISKELGWHFPWTKIKYWLRGYNSDTSSQLIRHENLPKSIEDSDWHIEFQQWTSTDIGFLPKKIKASQPPYSVKIIIYNWDLK